MEDYSNRSRFQRSTRSIESVTHNSRRELPSSLKRSRNAEIEDLGHLRSQMRIGVPKSLIDRFRRNNSLTVTDFANSVGTRKLKVPTVAAEDIWAVKFMNFIISADELLTEGLTREVPLVGLVNDVWVNGAIDEVQMPFGRRPQRPSLVETKTHSRPTGPSEPTKTRGRFQLMLYKHLWDIIVIRDFPAAQFFNDFVLNPQHTLSEEVQQTATSLGFSAKTLDDLVMHYGSTRRKLPPASDWLQLRFEFQEDSSLPKEEYFEYDAELLMNQIENILKFWKGERKARYVSREERWKCDYCHFKYECPSGNNTSHYKGTTGVAVAAAALAGRYGVQAWQAFKARPPSARMRKFYEGGFQPTMTKREAALILGVRESVPQEKVKEAHRKVMVANHPDAGGSHYLASKINEAKDVMLGRTKGSGSAF
ncbi:hypothetical protein Syun_016059 [Stephania yunnanensis]|uniref:J domain-containing protein n=1 Tax=Stephania yunnanensis TaxID=152371 RepID=A0AAP0J6P8_9MAGN